MSDHPFLYRKIKGFSDYHTTIMELVDNFCKKIQLKRRNLKIYVEIGL
ncbi:hypothetical protein J2T19_003807 [Paenibacillus tundrae]|uniref:Uncharacterized protein n=1 Tax=Paenibacillus tundrae TaxID=528187 RepID=A0ABT9WGC8_9BACL|nr:hypothetical protein [Paenibacillus tundrae]